MDSNDYKSLKETLAYLQTVKTAQKAVLDNLTLTHSVPNLVELISTIDGVKTKSLQSMLIRALDNMLTSKPLTTWLRDASYRDLCFEPLTMDDATEDYLAFIGKGKAPSVNEPALGADVSPNIQKINEYNN